MPSTLVPTLIRSSAAENSTNPTTETIIRNLAHELRQPLSALESIAFYLDLMINDEDPKTRKQLRRLRRLVQQSEWTVSNAVLTSCTTPLDLTSVCLADLVSECATTWAAENSAQVGMVRPEQDRVQMLDEEHIRLLMRNVLSFLRRGSQVSIGVTCLGEASELVVESEEMQVPEVDSLAICAIRKIVAAHQGTVDLEPALGGIQRICVTLPFQL